MLYKLIHKKVHIAPLAVFRMIFGFMMLCSAVRFMLKGWIYDLYVAPKYFFTYYGFGWVKPLGEEGMWAVFILMAIAALMIMLGCFYRIAVTVFFVLFTYVELIDKTNYLNHYYFVSIISLLMIFLPASGYFSLDILRKPSLKIKSIPVYFINVIKLQIGVVYFYAGLAKLNYDWLFNAMPLKIWLPAKSHLPLIGEWLNYNLTAYLFSWGGAFYDLLIPFILINKKLRWYGFMAVVIFHLMTSWLFQIGMFPLIMICSSLVFFSEDFHKRVISGISKLFRLKPASDSQEILVYKPILNKGLLVFFALHFMIQLLFPWRFLLYPGELFWTEEGYRFSWRVMLMEKSGDVTFRVKDPVTGGEGEVVNSDYLTLLQEKMMATQPDMILQFAHFLKEEYRKQGVIEPQIRAEAYVALNGRGSRLFLDPEVDLTKEKEGFQPKKWILPFEDNSSDGAIKLNFRIRNY